MLNTTNVKRNISWQAVPATVAKTENAVMAKNPTEPRERVVAADVLGSRVFIAMRARKMTQSQLAKSAALAQGDISKILNGKKTHLTLDVALRVARALMIRLNWLFYGTGEMDEDDCDDETETTDIRRAVTRGS
jgi:DNA-binding Xre family transcriptional regulator